MTEQVKVTINGLLKDLQDGLTREDIATKYGITRTSVKKIFMHPKLKNKKTIKAKTEEFVLIDDTDEVVQEAPQAAAEQVEEVVSEETVSEEPVEESDGVFGED